MDGEVPAGSRTLEFEAAEDGAEVAAEAAFEAEVEVEVEMEEAADSEEVGEPDGAPPIARAEVGGEADSPPPNLGPAPAPAPASGDVSAAEPSSLSAVCLTPSRTRRWARGDRDASVREPPDAPDAPPDSELKFKPNPKPPAADGEDGEELN